MGAHWKGDDIIPFSVIKLALNTESVHLNQLVLLVQ